MVQRPTWQTAALIPHGKGQLKSIPPKLHVMGDLVMFGITRLTKGQREPGIGPVSALLALGFTPKAPHNAEFPIDILGRCQVRSRQQNQHNATAPLKGPTAERLWRSSRETLGKIESK